MGLGRGQEKFYEDGVEMGLISTTVSLFSRNAPLFDTESLPKGTEVFR